MEPEFYTPQEIANKLRVKVFTVQEWLRKGELIGYKVGRDWRIRREDYEKFLRERKNR
jgi:excisionase family DNA binding protein